MCNVWEAVTSRIDPAAAPCTLAARNDEDDEGIDTEEDGSEDAGSEETDDEHGDDAPDNHDADPQQQEEAAGAVVPAATWT